jgi:hypothetical protein
LFSAEQSLIELIRDGLGALVLAGFFAVVYIATRRLVGEAGKHRAVELPSLPRQAYVIRSSLPIGRQHPLRVIRVLGAPAGSEQQTE